MQPVFIYASYDLVLITKNKTAISGFNKNLDKMKCENCLFLLTLLRKLCNDEVRQRSGGQEQDTRGYL